MFVIPASISSSERSFSKLKLDKNYLRSTMIQDRLSHLAITLYIIPIERNVTESIEYDDLIGYEMKRRKTKKQK